MNIINSNVEIVNSQIISSNSEDGINLISSTSNIQNLKVQDIQSDAIDIVTPTDTHFNIASKCLKLNKHFFIEKPLTKTLSEAQKLIDLINDKKIVAQVGHIERFNPAFKSVNSLITKPLFIESHRLEEFNPRGTDV